MGVYTFLKSLPATLGVAGFFAYLWVGQTRIGGELLKKVVDKLRADPHLDVKQYGALTPAKIIRLVRSDERVREKVNQGDRDLLRLLIIFQYLLTGLVLMVCASLIGLTVWLYIRPEPLAVFQNGPEAVNKDAGGLLVDLDPLRVDWTTTGQDESVSVFLENVDTHKRSEKRTVASNVRSVTFDPADVVGVASYRGFHGKNRIRSIIEWRGGKSESDPKDVAVGITVELRLFGNEIASDGTEHTIHTLFATIDRSTENLPLDYAFNGDFVGMLTNKSPIVVPLRSNNKSGEIEIPNLDRIDWTRPVGFVYGGPDDTRIIRTHVYR